MTSVAALSVSSNRRLARAREWLLARAPAEEVVIVGANLDAANELARRVATEKGAAFGWHRLTLSQLVAAAAAPTLAAGSLAPISRLGAEAVAVRVIHRLRDEGRLGRFGPVSATPGFPKAIAQVLSELRLARLSSDSVATVAPDLVPVIQAYQAELSEAGLVDWPGVADVALQAVSSGEASDFVGLPLLLLDVAIVNETEKLLVEALAKTAPSVVATVPMADRPTLDHLRSIRGWKVENLDQDADSGSVPRSALGRLQRNLFNGSEHSWEESPDASVTVFSAPGEGRESVEIARRILALASQGIPFDRMAVLLRTPDEYRAYLLEAFARANVPAHFARGAVRPDPAGRAFFSLLKCAAEGLSATRFAEYLSLGQVPDADAGGAPPEAQPGSDRWRPPDLALDSELAIGPAETANGEDSPPEGAVVTRGQLRAPWRWERLLVEAAVIGGSGRWRRRIQGLGNELRLELAYLNEDPPRAAALERTLEDLAAFAGYALPLIGELEALPPAASWGEWFDRLGALATRSLREPDRVLAIFAELNPLAPVGPASLSEVVTALEPMLLEAAVPPASQRYGKVFVGPVETVRGLSFDAVFVPGLAEKMFPKKIVEEPILPDSMRIAMGSDLIINQARLEAERLALALAAGAADRQVCFSYPRIDLTQSRARVPSFYALETVRAAEGRLPDFAELGRRAETATITRLGWPAPPDPADAIDDAERDLAILDRLAKDPGEAAGAARYLVTANPYLSRALRARYQRWGRAWTSADGMTSRSDLARTIMARHALPARSYSPTALQAYASCPYRFFLHAIHGLAPRLVPEAIDELDALQRGSLIHDVQFALFVRLRDEGLLPVGPDNLDHAGRLLDAAMEAVAARYRDDLAPAIDRVWEDGIAAIHADLREWLRRISEDDSGYVPWRFELSFGLGRGPRRRPADPRSVLGAIRLDCGIEVRGSIDLVERHPNGQARATDHKTGKANVRRGQLMDGGRSLQPLLYALAAEKLFAGEAEVASARLYFCTSVGGFDELVVPLDGRARGAALQLADTIGQSIAQPFLPAAPDKGQCDLCDYRGVCGPYEELRTARKPREALEPLTALRSLP